MTRYRDIRESFDKIVETSLKDWEGKGTEEFGKDAQKMKTNIACIEETLRYLCSAICDCQAIIEEVDRKNKENNMNPLAS
ncbi:MAG: hypothetical protein LBC73_01800 [Oscillospiraceae bacterium]|nr:hypothetical protein [Oscillospiraceae bacterium]